MSKKINRCEWVTEDSVYIKYHDTEWGVPVYDDNTLFEFLVLEGAQAGLSWITILKRREGYRRIFHDFDPSLVAKMNEQDIKKALEDPGIIRNRLKLDSAVRNAKVFLEIQKEFGSFSDYLWRYVEGNPIIGGFDNLKDVPITTKVSDELSKDLKLRGMNFVGSTIIYAYMQAVGLVNDHTAKCFLAPNNKMSKTSVKRNMTI